MCEEVLSLPDEGEGMKKNADQHPCVGFLLRNILLLLLPGTLPSPTAFFKLN